MENWISKEAHQNLLNELQDIDKNIRPKIQQKLEAARREGDLSENAGYHSAKDDLSKLEARVKKIKKLINESVVGESDNEKIIKNGKKVSLKLNNVKKVILIGNRENQKTNKEMVISLNSPLGEALKNKTEKEKFTFTLPNNTEQTVEILKIENYS